MTPYRLKAASLLALSFSIISIACQADRVHTVTRGDSLWALARTYKVSPAAIAAANKMPESAILALGKKLVIPGSVSPESVQPVAETDAAPGTVRVGVTESSTALRDRTSESSKRVALIPPGATVKVVAASSGWLRVVTPSGKIGWVPEQAVEVSTLAVVAWQKMTADRRQPSTGASSAVGTAYRNLGARYRYGGTSRGGFDCSGFTRYVYAKHGVTLPHSSAAQSKVGKPVQKSDLREGDLVFFSRGGKSIGHVGIYTGDGKFIHASNPRGGVKIDSLNSGYYLRNYRGARRVK